MIDGLPSANDPTLTGSSQSADLAPGSRVADRYTIEQRVGTGGMGVVYRARDDALGVTVALKLLRPELASRPDAFERFRQELLLARQVSSPRVVRIHDIAQDDGRWFITMDFVDGEALDRWLDREGALPVEQAISIARQVAEGLQAAHARGIVHRDLKPANILLDGSGGALISDFGVARSLGSSGLTQTGAVIGTPDYVAPEQARGDAVDGRADLYALGLVLYEMLAGSPAFDSLTPAESMARRLVSAPPAIESRRADVPRWLARLVANLLRPSPAHRPRDAAAVLRAIAERRVPARLPGWTWPAAGIAAAALAAAALLWTGAGPGPEAALPPAPKRIVLLPEPPAGDDLLAAAVESLRHGLASRPELAVADGERTAIALSQSRLGASGPSSDDGISSALTADRLVRIEHLRDDRGHRLRASIVGPGPSAAATVEGPLRQTVVAATRDLLPPLATALGAEAPPVSPLNGDEDLQAYASALALLADGQADAAADAFERLLAVDPDHAPALAGLLEAARQAGRRPLALDAARRAQSLPGQPLSATAGPWLALLGGDAAGALAQALPVNPAMAGDPGRHVLRAELALAAGDLEAAESSLAIAVANDPKDPRAWFLLGKTSILRGDLRIAVDEQLVRALVMFKRSRHLRGEAETVNALGVGYARLGQAGDALEQYGKALALRRQLGDRRGVASSLRNLAQLDLVRGELSLAAQRLDEARGLFSALGDDAGLAAVENELGLLEEERGDYQAALSAYRRSLRSREGGGDPLGVAESLNNIGFAHYQLGDYVNAGALWRQAREAFAGLEDANGVVRVDQNLGLLAIARGDWPGARARLEASLREAEARQMAEEAAVSLRNLVELDLLEGGLDQAQARLERARGLFDSRDDQRGRMDTALLGARLAIAAGRPQDALAALESLPGGLEAATPEQAAIAGLLHARASAPVGSPARIPADVRDRVARAGIRVLQAEARVLSAPTPDAAIDDEVRQLGHLPLQLDWLERSAALALSRGDTDDAGRRVQEALALVPDGRAYLRRGPLEALGRQARGETPDTP